MPQPIDPNTELGRAAAAERIQLISDRASLAAQARGATEAADRQLATESQVRETEEKNQEIDRELRRRSPFMGKRRRKKERRDEESATFYNAAEERELADDPDDHGLDVTV